MPPKLVTPLLLANSPSTSVMALFYPASFINHPNIGHTEMMGKLWPNLKPERLSLGKLVEYYQVTYLMLCKDFETYEEYRQEQHWEEFKNRRKKIKIF